MALPEAFARELGDIVGTIAGTESRLRALKDFAQFEELPTAVSTRIDRKIGALEVTRSGLIEIPDLASPEVDR